GRQELLDPLVAVARPRLFLRQIESLAHNAGGDHVERPRRKGVHPLHRAAGIDLAADRIDLRKEFLAVVHPADGHALALAKVTQSLPIGSKWAMGDAKETWFGADRHAAKAYVRRHIIGLTHTQLRHH